MYAWQYLSSLGFHDFEMAVMMLTGLGKIGSTVGFD